MESQSDKTNVAQAEYDNALHCEESEEQLVRELVKFKLYGDATTLDGVIEAAKRNIKETKARVEELKTLFEGEQNGDQQHLGIVPGFSTSSEVLAGSIEANMEDKNILQNRASISVKKFLKDLADEMNDTGYKALDFAEIEENNSYATPEKIKETSKETPLVVCVREDPRNDEGKTVLVSDGGEEPKPVGDLNTDKFPALLIHGDARRTVDDSFSTLNESQYDEIQTVLASDVESEPKPIVGNPIPDKFPALLIHDDARTTIDVPLPTLNELHHQTVLLADVRGGEPKPVGDLNTDKFPVLLVHDDARTTIDVFLPTLNESHHEEIQTVLESDVEGEPKPIVGNPNSDKFPVSLVHGDARTINDGSLSTLNESHHDEIQTLFVSDVGGDEPCTPAKTGDSNTDVKLSVSLMYSEVKTVDENVANQVEGERRTTDVLDKDVVKNCSSDVEVQNDGCPLPSSEHTCSERQSTDDVHSYGAEDISNQVSSATGSPSECENPRSGCVNIESVMSSKQVSHLPSSTSINEQREDSQVKDTSTVEVVQDGESIAVLHSFPQHDQNKVEDDKIVLTGSSLPSKNEDEQENDKSKPKKKNKEKKKAKVDTKDMKRLKDEKTKKTKSKKFHRRLLSLFCFCFKSQETEDENNEETKQSTTEMGRSHIENMSQTSFVTIDLNN